MQSEAHRITAIVSTYKSERFMRGCLEDLVGQTIFPQTEVIVIDSASPENEATIVREFQERHPNIRYVRTDERETLYAAWNRAIALSSAPYLTNANTDDRHAPDAFARLAAVLDKHSDVDVVYARTAITHVAGSKFGAAPITGYFKARKFDRQRLFYDCLPGPQPMWRRSLHDRFGFFDPSFVSSGDYEFWLRISGQARFGHVRKCLGLFLDSPGGLMRRAGSQAEQEAELARDRHWPKEWGPRTPRKRSWLDHWTRRSTYRQLMKR